MKDWSMLSRRQLFGFLAGLFIVPRRVLADEVAKPSDRGIGGTGIDAGGIENRPGVAFIGRIQGFGSIFVNNVRIAYRRNVSVTVDGRVRSPADLRIGHVVNAIARKGPGGFVTDSIAVEHEVVGTIEAVSASEIVVLGQRIAVSDLPPVPWWRRGARVAVSGLRRPDGVIVASLVERHSASWDRIKGVARKHNGEFMIGGLRLHNLNPRWLGHNVIVEGEFSTQGFRIVRVRRDTLPIGKNVRRLSIEAYVTREHGHLYVGPGLTIADLSPSLGIRSDRPIVLTWGIDQTGAPRQSPIRAFEPNPPRGMPGATGSSPQDGFPPVSPQPGSGGNPGGPPGGSRSP